MAKLDEQRYLTTAEITELQELVQEIGKGFKHVLVAVGNVFIHIGDVVREVRDGVAEFDFNISEDEREEPNDGNSEFNTQPATDFLNGD